MGSESMRVRQAQLVRVEARFEEWRAALAARGIEGSAASRNARLRKLQADVRRAKGRISAMAAAEAHVKTVAEKGLELKAAKANAPKAKPQAKPQAKQAKQAKPAKKK